MSSKDIEDKFELHKAAENSSELLDELFAFGQLMISEVSGRTVILEGKATSIMGWTTGLLALFLLQPDTPAVPRSFIEQLLTVLGAVSALVALIASVLALRVQSWQWPSQQDWLCPNLFGHPTVLRRAHVLSLLETHEAHSGVNDRKAQWVQLAQAGLFLAGLSLGLQIVAAVVVRWL